MTQSLIRLAGWGERDRGQYDVQSVEWVPGCGLLLSCAALPQRAQHRPLRTQARHPAAMREALREHRCDEAICIPAPARYDDTQNRLQALGYVR